MEFEGSLVDHEWNSDQGFELGAHDCTIVEGSTNLQDERLTLHWGLTISEDSFFH